MNRGKQHRSTVKGKGGESVGGETEIRQTERWKRRK